MLEIEHLGKVYEDGTVGVEDLNLTLSAGEICVLLGANGAGKTSTIMLILGFTEPTEGTVRINGIDVQKDPLEAKRHVAYVSENVTLYGNFTAHQNLAFFTELAGRGKDDYQLQALGMGLVGFGLAAWYFWPIALGLVRLQRWAGGAAGFLVPLGFLGTVYFNARHWLRKVDLGWRPRLGFTLLSLALALLLALLDAAWLVQRPRGAGAMALACLALLTLSARRGRSG